MPNSKVVLKFGGSSLSSASAFKKVAHIISGFLDSVVIVSAVGTRSQEEKKTTDILYAMAQKAFDGKNYLRELSVVRNKHKKIIKALKLDARLLDPDFRKLKKTLSRKSKRTVGSFFDSVLSFGELMSAKILSSLLQRQGVNALSIDAADIGMITNSNFGCASLLPESTSLIKKNLQHTEGIPVITGFIAKDMRGRRTTFGRGGSDFSASTIAAAIGADELRIYTDVDGVFSADPRVVKKAKTIPELSFYEAAELAYFGARVLHPEMVYPAISKSILVRVLNTFNPYSTGTAIVSRESNKIKAITWKKDVTVINVYSARMLAAHGFLAKIFNVFAKYKIAIDVLATSEVNVSLTVGTKPSPHLIKELSQFADVSVESNFATLSLVGDGIRDKRGVLGKLFTAVRGFPIKMVSQGASKRSITFLVKEKYLKSVITKVFNTFFHE